MTALQFKAMATSYARVFLAAAITAYLSLEKAVTALSWADLKSVAYAGVAALLLTLVNFLRTGETRFGRGSEDVGMGHEDQLGPGGEVQYDQH